MPHIRPGSLLFGYRGGNMEVYGLPLNPYPAVSGPREPPHQPSRIRTPNYRRMGNTASQIL